MLFNSVFLFSESKDVKRVPSNINHDTFLEIVWTVIPSAILVSIALPSYALLYAMSMPVSDPAITLKIVGNQWYWTYEYSYIFDSKCGDLNNIRNDVCWPYLKSAADLTAPILKQVLRYNPTIYPTLCLNLSVRQYFGISPHLFNGLEDFYVFKVRVPTEFTKYMMEKYLQQYSVIYKVTQFLWIELLHSIRANRAFTSERQNIYYILADVTKTHSDFGISYLKKYLDGAMLLQPKRTAIESYMTAGFASEYLGHPKSAVLDYKAGIHESRLESGNRAIYLLETNCLIALPLDKTVRILVTSEDVIHSWAVPSFGVKVDAIPGRLNQVFVTPRVQGVFYGQCSEICGVNHAFMPIKVRVMNNSSFYNWLIYHFAEPYKGNSKVKAN